MKAHLVGGTIENQYGVIDMALGEFELLYCRSEERRVGKECRP